MSDTAFLPRARRKRLGLTPRQERTFNLLAAALVSAMVLGWAVSIGDQYLQRQESEETTPTPARLLASRLTDPRTPETAYLDDAQLDFLDTLRGRSGKLQAAFRAPGDTLTSPSEQRAPDLRRQSLTHLSFEPRHRIGTHVGRRRSLTGPLLLPGCPEAHVGRVQDLMNKATRAIDDLRVITLVPFAEKKNDRIGLYYLGRWPFEGKGPPPRPSYANPTGFVEVTRENQDTAVSEHFKLRDFLTKDQFDVWPKYLLIDSRLIDKLELIVQELEEEGHPVEHVQIMSGFRTPIYNHSGGNTGGRASLSRRSRGIVIRSLLGHRQSKPEVFPGVFPQLGVGHFRQVGSLPLRELRGLVSPNARSPALG